MVCDASCAIGRGSGARGPLVHGGAVCGVGRATGRVIGLGVGLERMMELRRRGRRGRWVLLSLKGLIVGSVVVVVFFGYGEKSRKRLQGVPMDGIKGTCVCLKAGVIGTRESQLFSHSVIVLTYAFGVFSGSELPFALPRHCKSDRVANLCTTLKAFPFPSVQKILV